MRADIFAKYDHQLGFSRVPEPLSKRLFSPDFFDLAQDAVQGQAFEEHRQEQDDNRDPDLRQRLGILQLVHAFINRKQPTHREEQNRNDKTPEVTELAVAQRVLIVGRSLRLLEPEIEQNLVAGIRIRMDRFSQHAAGPRQHRRPGLGYRDAEVGKERIQDRPCYRIVSG